jgi:medium-chain acyl-[acyl-carrier-protein] hydrolase
MTLNQQPAAGSMGPYTFEIRGTDTDYHDRLHLFSLFSFMQEAAYHNAQAHGIGSDNLDPRGLCWLLIRISVRLDHLPRWGEIITVDTWSRGAPKLIFLRDYDFYGQDGRKFGSATSEWLIASKDTHRPQRPDTVLTGDHRPFSNRAVFAGPLPRPVPLEEPAASQSILTKYADFSDIDRNHHVNNTRYVAWCMDAVHAAFRVGQAEQGCISCDELTEGFPDIRIRGLDIHYISEVRLGSKIHCYCQPVEMDSGSEYRTEARRADNDSVVFRARVLI